MATKMTDDNNTILATLEQKLTAARERHDETQCQSRSIAFAAHVDGGEARKQLDKLNADAVKHSAEIMSLEAAIVEARRRVDAALAAEADDVAKERAERALEHLERFRAELVDLGEHLGRAAACAVRAGKLFRLIEAAGYASTSWAAVKVGIGNAIITVWMFSDFRIGFLAPDQRRTFAELADAFTRVSLQRATARVNRGKASKAA